MRGEIKDILSELGGSGNHVPPKTAKYPSYTITVVSEGDGNIDLMINGQRVPALSGVVITAGRAGFNLKIDQLHSLQDVLDQQFLPSLNLGAPPVGEGQYL